MKKAYVLVAAVLLLGMLLTGCGGGNVDRVVRNIGSSEIYTAVEIEQAMDTAIAYFDDEFDGCTLTAITYDESRSAKAGEEWAEQYGEEEAIVLISSFAVDASGGDGSLQPNSTYNNWQWILTRSNSGKWTLQTWGYG